MSKTLKTVSQIAKLLAKDSQPILLSTIGLDGCPRSRYIGAFRIRDSAEIFLISMSNANKIKEIRKNSKVQVILSDNDYKRVLTINGNASIVQDIDLRRTLYEETKPLKIYPVFNDNFGVIHFVPVQAEYLNLKVCNDPFVINILRH